MNIRVILIAGFITASLYACKSTANYYNSKGELRNISGARLINRIESQYIPCETLLLKRFKADYTIGEESKSFKGNLYLNRDSSITVSIIMVKEWFRVRLTPDKVEILDRTKREYSVGDYSLLWDKFMIEVDYDMLQSILLNELYVYPIGANSRDDIKKYKHYLGEDVYLLKSLKNRRYSRINRPNYSGSIVMHEFTVLPEVFKVSDVYLNDFNANSELKLIYSYFIEVNDNLFATHLNLEGRKSNSKFILSLKFDDVDFDTETSIGFKVSSKYKVIDLLND